MALIVQKYGGTSMGSIDRIKNVAKRVKRWHDNGHQVVVVVSAMSGETNRLIDLARQISSQPDPREYDQMVSTGEQVSISLLAMAIKELGIGARSFTGRQVPIRTDSSHNKARIESIDDKNIREQLDAGNIVIVAGFQGIDDEGNATTLGRGGSDTTGVAIAAALGADECQIYTDVDGVYTTDPRIVARARKLELVTYEEMLELASVGAKVPRRASVSAIGVSGTTATPRCSPWPVTTAKASSGVPNAVNSGAPLAVGPGANSGTTRATRRPAASRACRCSRSQERSHTATHTGAPLCAPGCRAKCNCAASSSTRSSSRPSSTERRRGVCWPAPRGTPAGICTRCQDSARAGTTATTSPPGRVGSGSKAAGAMAWRVAVWPSAVSV